MTAMAICRTCGAQLLEDARFCHGCGGAVQRAGTSAEYKQVTVLFADVVHSMDIANRVGAERLREIMAGLVDRAAAAVGRHGGTVDKFTGDGIMAIFGAPVALEDHAMRACRAALEIHTAIGDLANEVVRQDRVELRLRIGLNSGQVIAGEVGTAATGYTAIGEQVGMAQRMESVAPPGGVMLSESTAALVENSARLADPELVSIKGAPDPVKARRLIDLPSRHGRTRGQEATLIGRRWELSAVEGLLDRALGGQGTVVGVVGPPGIGKSRLIREAEALAQRREAAIFSTFCDSHTSQIPLHAVGNLLRAATGVEDLEASAAREHIRGRAVDSEAEDLLFFNDLLGIADPEVPIPSIDPDARRRRLTALVRAALMARDTPAVYVIEDIHWIDEVSESLLADFLSVIPQTPSLVLMTYRPEYQGPLARLTGEQTIALAPLSDSESAIWSQDYSDPPPPLPKLRQTISARAAGNPFFAEEIVRELAQRAVLVGQPGRYTSCGELGDVSVPATLQATIAARIDHLDPGAKNTLNAAAVIGNRFSASMLKSLESEPALDPLAEAQLIDQVRFAGDPEYVFHHPLIRSVAYESQLKSDRGRRHRRLAEAIEQRDPASVDENAAMIAEHREAAGDLREAYSWHMRAGAWSASRDVAAAMVSWQRSSRVADALPQTDADSVAMRIAPRTLLCGNSWRRFHDDISGVAEELRELCALNGDSASLAIALAGLAFERMFECRVTEASELASEFMQLVESLGDPALIIGLSPMAIIAKMQAAEFGAALRWSQMAVDLADDDPRAGNFFVGSPLAMALAFRGTARAVMGFDGWQEDFDHARAMALATDPISYATVTTYKYLVVPRGVGLAVADDAALAELELALESAEQSGEDIALVMVKLVLGLMLLHHPEGDRQRGLALITELRDTCIRERFALNILPYFDIYAAREKAALGDVDGAVAQLRAAAEDTVATGNLGVYDLVAVALVETLLARGGETDVIDAEREVERFDALPVDFEWVVRDLTVLRLRAQIAYARGLDAEYREYRDRCAARAASLGWAWTWPQ